MGTLRNSAEERQARKAIQYHQKQEKQHRERGEGDHHYHRQNYEHYTNGWQPSPIPLEHRPFYSYNNSFPPPHQQTDIPVYRDRIGREQQNGRPLAASHSDSSYGHREIPVNREQNYSHKY
uniref:Uncharacterized protein n=1 Tax=Meloidogyne javanica TaxID=6303 RepID=A0A915LKM5_MELJA